MKAILIAAGMGRRLSPYTDDRPKCLVEVAGQPMIKRSIAALRSVGVDRFVVIRGYLADRLTAALSDEPGVSFVDNFDFRRNNILLSLMCAESEMDDGFFCSYADIIYRPEVAVALAESREAMSLVVDPHWVAAYAGRSDHPIAEAELCAVEPGSDRIRRLGKQAVPVAEAAGEFIGLWRASAAAARSLRELYHRRRSELGLDQPYGRAPRLEVAYLTDLFNDLIEQGQALHAVRIAQPSAWREIDTVQDLERAAATVSW